MNSLFRREDSPHLASDLIRWAVAHTRATWPGVPSRGIVTFINAAKTRHKRDPGRCYARAGWVHVGFTKAGLWVYQQRQEGFTGARGRVSEPMPTALPVAGSQPSLFGPMIRQDAAQGPASIHGGTRD